MGRRWRHDRSDDEQSARQGLKSFFPCRTHQQILEHLFELGYHGNISDLKELRQMSRKEKLKIREQLIEQKRKEKEKREETNHG